MSRARAETQPTPGESEDWIAVVDALVAGDRIAFARFNRLVTGLLIHFRAYDFENDWDDLRQEVLTAVVQNLRSGTLRDAKAFVGYVRTITRNKFVDRLKRRLRCRENETLPWEEEIARDAGGDGDPELRRELLRALAGLEERDRVLIERVYLRGETYEEASRATGVPLGTLKRRLREGLTALRKRLGELEGVP